MKRRRIMHWNKTLTNRIIVTFAALSIMTAALYGCATHGQTGSVAGAGVGALIGQAIGRNTAGTLIGAGIGAGVGYLIGNDQDKKAASMQQAPETGAFGGTTWKAVNMDPVPTPPYETYIIEFSPDGWLKTSETFADGTKKTDKENYRVAGDTLIINKPGYIINAKYVMENKRLKIMLDDYNAEFKQVK